MMKEFTITTAFTSRETRSVDAYIKEMKRYTVPTIEEETRLAETIRDGTPEERKRAKNELVVRNMRFVLTVAKRYQDYGLPLEDLLSSGCIGLLKAADSFDSTKGFKFITYAIYWIRQEIFQDLTEHASFLRLPANQRAMLTRLKALSSQFEQENMRKPTNLELADLAGIDADKIPLYNYIGKTPVSLDAAVGDDESPLSEMLSGDFDNPDAGIAQEGMAHDLRVVLERLSEKERTTLELLYGLKDGIGYSIATTANMMGVSEESIRHYRDRAINRLRNSEAARELLLRHCA
ncbi:MAG: RNA polymerase sigma factor RpoD/SigA [Bacteroidales bacterium]|nr:RNA polymerase sigma factor RpoD/SigA [Bacteroidales bacterium]